MIRVADRIILALAHSAAGLPRGYGKAITWLARRSSGLQALTVPIPRCGAMVLDLRESVCIPLFRHGCYQHQTAEDEFTALCVGPGSTAFDIGANIGFYSRMLSTLVGPSGRVIAVEPMPRALDLLRKNLQLALPNITLVPSAIGPFGCRAEIREAEALDTSVVTFQESGSMEVVTLDSLMDRYSLPDFVKIDVEGAELGALQGAARMIAAPNPPIFMFEYIPDNTRSFGGYGLGDLLACFGASYRFYRIASPLQLVALNADPGATNDYVAIPPNALPRFEAHIQQ